MNKYEKRFERIVHNHYEADKKIGILIGGNKTEKLKKLIRRHICEAIAIRESLLVYFYPFLLESGKEKGKNIEHLLNHSDLVCASNEKGEKEYAIRSFYDAVFQYNRIFSKLFNDKNKSVPNLIDMLINNYIKDDKEQLMFEFAYLKPAPKQNVGDTTIIYLD